MVVSSPPKRITRARAAAKTGSGSASAATATKTTKVVAAAAKPVAKPVTKPVTKPAASKPATTRTATSMKRKTRCDENEDEEEESRRPTEASISEAMNKPARPRGRPKKVVDPEPEPGSIPEQGQEPKPAAPVVAATATATRATRGRAKKATEEVPKPETAKTPRTRTKKTPVEDDKTTSGTEPVKKATRGRPPKSSGTICTEPATNPTPGLKSNIVRPASRLATTKKSVSFQEPEKENVVPPHSKAKAKTEPESATGMRAKPVRKTVAAARATRASARSTTTTDKEKSTPLSPKKDAPNRPLSRSSDSDDELATYEKMPLKPLLKSPVKPPNNKKLEVSAPVTVENNEMQQHAHNHDELAGASVFASPAKRLPSTPFRDMIKSPAKRAEGVPTLLFSANNDTEILQSPLKASVLQSPAKRPQMPIMAFQAPSTEHSTQPRSPMKTSFLQSPAKRPMSPIKLPGSSTRPIETETSSSLTAPLTSDVDEQGTTADVDEDADEEEDGNEGEEAHQAEQEHPAMESIEPIVEMVNGDENDDDIKMSQEAEDDVLESPGQLEFPGRLSAVLPRHADPAFQDKLSPSKAPCAAQLEPIADIANEVIATSESKTMESETLGQEDTMDIDEVEAGEIDRPVSPPADTPPRSAVRPLNPLFGLHESDPISDNLDSEPRILDDTALSFAGVPATPTPRASKAPRSGLPSSAIKNASRAIRSVSRASKLGFTPLAKPLGDWRSGSPLKNSNLASSPTNGEGSSMIEDLPAAAGQSPGRGTFFDDEMRVRAKMEADTGSDAEAEMMAAIEADLAASFDDPVFDDIPVTNEDVELAAEANEMSLLEPELLDEVIEGQTLDDSISEASQEYGDENAVPIDPALLGFDASHARQSMCALPVTPVRPASRRTFNTTTKVPLKAADDSTPKSAKNRSASASRLPVKRPAGPTRNATVISYSPTKETAELDMMGEGEQPPVTPSKSDIWSSIGTPARTPRHDLNAALLRGAVVFVDVHTSEGADASTVFIDLLTQMGARCVKSWPWNPSSPTEGDFSTSKIGITHVVYKDGGKRTMEKVRESGGVVQCVGVGWVLDCERENEWLDEAPYYIDTSLVPRGGARRRKSMEPKALANLNSTLVTPVKPTSSDSARECQTVPNNHMSRRDSTAWMRSPSNPDEDEDMEDVGEDEWDGSVLTPVPKTPAPEALHRYITELEVTPETPGAEWSGEYSPDGEQMLTRTAPPKQSVFANLGQGLLGPNKDQNVMMRLMAARRKSLQFAPKIASPLSKAWN